MGLLEWSELLYAASPPDQPPAPAPAPAPATSLLNIFTLSQSCGPRNAEWSYR